MRRSVNGPALGWRPGPHVPLALLAMLCAALVAACGGTGGGAAGRPSPAGASPTPVPSPQITSGAPPAAAVAVVKDFWDRLGSGDKTGAFALTTAGSALRSDDYGLDSARFVGLVPHTVGRGPASDVTVAFAVTVFIEPASTQAGGQWTGAREYRLFEQVVRMSDGTWRLVASGTGP
jgi:hypothetical protein